MVVNSTHCLLQRVIHTLVSCQISAVDCKQLWCYDYFSMMYFINGSQTEGLLKLPKKNNSSCQNRRFILLCSEIVLGIFHTCISANFSITKSLWEDQRFNTKSKRRRQWIKRLEMSSMYSNKHLQLVWRFFAKQILCCKCVVVVPCSRL